MLSQQHLCQRWPKSVDLHRSYSVLHQCRFFETQCISENTKQNCRSIESGPAVNVRIKLRSFDACAYVTLTFTGRPWCTNLTYIFYRCTCTPQMKFLRSKLSEIKAKPAQDRQTDRQRRRAEWMIIITRDWQHQATTQSDAVVRRLTETLLRIARKDILCGLTATEGHRIYHQLTEHISGYSNFDRTYLAPFQRFGGLLVHNRHWDILYRCLINAVARSEYVKNFISPKLHTLYHCQRRRCHPVVLRSFVLT